MRVGATGLDGHDDFLGNARELLGHAVPARKHRVLSNFKDASHGRKVWQMTGAAAIRREHLVATYDARSAATVAELMPLRYTDVGADGLPAHVRSASALRRFENRLVIVQDDVNALAVQDERGIMRAVLLPAHESGMRVFDDTLGNKRDKLDLEACVTLPDGRLVAFGSGSMPQREQVVVWSGGQESPWVREASSLYRELRAAVTSGAERLNVEGAVVVGAELKLFQRGNDARDARRAAANAIAAVDCGEFVGWLDGGGAAAPPCVRSVTSVDLGELGDIPFSFTDAVALDEDHVVVLACAEDSVDAISDGAVLGCRVGLLDARGLRLADVYDATGQRTRLKLEGIERRGESRTEFDVAVDVDRPTAPAQLGRLVWNWH
jgi:hypothetical protein